MVICWLLPCNKVALTSHYRHADYLSVCLSFICLYVLSFYMYVCLVPNNNSERWWCIKIFFNILNKWLSPSYCMGNSYTRCICKVLWTHFHVTNMFCQYLGVLLWILWSDLPLMRSCTLKYAVMKQISQLIKWYWQKHL